MIKRLKDNPILVYQMSNDKWLSPRTAWLIAVGLTVVGLAPIIISLAISPDDAAAETAPISMLIWMPEMLLLIVGPLLVARVAVVETARTIASDKYQLIRLSPLSEREIVHGFLACTVFRMRLLWMLAGGLLLPSIAAWGQFSLGMGFIFACEVELSMPEYDCTAPIPPEYIMEVARESATWMLSYAASFVAWSWLAITLGVWMAFRFRRKGIGLAVTLPVVLLMTVASFIMCFDPYWLPANAIRALPWIAIGAFVLGLVAYLLTVRYVRKTTK